MLTWLYALSLITEGICNDLVTGLLHKTDTWLFEEGGWKSS